MSAKYSILQKADANGRAKVLAAIRDLKLKRADLAYQLRSLDPTRTGISRLRRGELEEALANLAGEPTLDLLREVEQVRWLDLKAHQLRDGWGWVAVAAEVIR